MVSSEDPNPKEPGGAQGRVIEGPWGKPSQPIVVRGAQGIPVALILDSGRIEIQNRASLDDVSLAIWERVEAHIRLAWEELYGGS